jgi:lysophospholipase L1-like esterase
VHQEIGRIQKQVAQLHGCHVWSMFEAMGGAGSAYRWARQNPPLMARDLIHFTVPGYQRLAQLMAKDLGWGPALFGDASVPEVNR